MTPTESAIEVVKDYKRFVIKDPKWWYGQGLLEQWSIQSWAVGEIILELKAYPNESPLDVLERLRKRWDNWACHPMKLSYIFSIAYDTVTNVIDYLIK